MKKTGIITLLALLAGFATAEVIYQDDFSGSSSSALNGTSPDIGSGTWTGPTGDIMADGSSPGTAHGFAYLPLTMTSNEVYTISLDLDIGSLESENICFSALALATSGGNVNTYPPSAGYFSYLLIRKNGAARAYYGGISAAETDTGLYSGTIELSMIVDTTGETWSYDYQVNGSSIEAVSGAPAYNDQTLYLRVGHYAGMGAYTLENLSVTTVPEPATIGLFGLSSLAIFGLRRFRG